MSHKTPPGQPLVRPAPQAKPFIKRSRYDPRLKAILSPQQQTQDAQIDALASEIKSQEGWLVLEESEVLHRARGWIQATASTVPGTGEALFGQDLHSHNFAEQRGPRKSCQGLGALTELLSKSSPTDLLPPHPFFDSTLPKVLHSEIFFLSTFLMGREEHGEVSNLLSSNLL